MKHTQDFFQSNNPLPPNIVASWLLREVEDYKHVLMRRMEVREKLLDSCVPLFKEASRWSRELLDERKQQTKLMSGAVGIHVEVRDGSIITVVPYIEIVKLFSDEDVVKEINVGLTLMDKGNISRNENFQSVWNIDGTNLTSSKWDIVKVLGTYKEEYMDGKPK